MAERLTPAMMMPKRPRGRPRKDGQPPRQRGEAGVSEAMRLGFLERGRVAFIEAEQKKQEYQSACRTYAQVVRDAKRMGVPELPWTLQALRRAPLAVEQEIGERLRMAHITGMLTKEKAVAQQAAPAEAKPAGPGPAAEMPSEDDAHAYRQGERAFLLERALATNPYGPLTSMHKAWARGWRAQEQSPHNRRSA